MSNQLELDVAFKDEPTDAVVDLMKQIGAREVEEVPQRGMTGIETVIVGVIVVNALAGLVIKLLPLWKCGVVIDARGRRIRTEKNCELPRGSVLVIAKDGTKHTLERPSDVEIGDLLKTVLESKT